MVRIFFQNNFSAGKAYIGLPPQVPEIWPNPITSHNFLSHEPMQAPMKAIFEDITHTI